VIALAQVAAIAFGGEPAVGDEGRDELGAVDSRSLRREEAVVSCEMLSLDRLPCGDLLRGLGHGRTVATGARWATRCLRCGGDADASSTSEDSSCSAYARARRDALDAGWTETELLHLGWGPVTTHEQRRRQSSARTRTTRPPVSGPTHSPTSAALDHPATEQEWANVIDGPVSTPQPHDAADVDGVDRGAAFVDSVQAGTIG
jgi:hypothetical protein